MTKIWTLKKKKRYLDQFGRMWLNETSHMLLHICYICYMLLNGNFAYVTCFEFRRLTDETSDITVD